MMNAFTQVQPTLDNYWRAVILFGRNVASYKFALGASLLELVRQGKESVPLAELAVPFSRHLADHLRGCNKQATSLRSRYLDECRKYNRGDLTREQLSDATVRLGFNNVIDAFHIVAGGPVGVRFFEDERPTPAKAIRLTDDLFRLAELYKSRNLPAEVEARWRLVETAWELSLPAAALEVAYDDVTGTLVTVGRVHWRKAVAPCRDALNGYRVTAFDASPAMALHAERLTGLPVRVLRFQAVDYGPEFDGVWACASLLHVPRAEAAAVLDHLVRALRPGGVLFASVKFGEVECERDGPWFTDYTPAALQHVLHDQPALEVIRVWVTNDLRRLERAGAKWVNAIAVKRSR